MSWELKEKPQTCKTPALGYLLGFLFTFILGDFLTKLLRQGLNSPYTSKLVLSLSVIVPEDWKCRAAVSGSVHHNVLLLYLV